MKLKKSSTRLIYVEAKKISLHELNMKYNPAYITARIMDYEEAIQEMYHQNTSHVTHTGTAWVSVSCPIEDLTIKIIDMRERLECYKKYSDNRLQQLFQVLDKYTDEEKRDYYRYITSDGKEMSETIKKLQYDLYQVVNNERIVRHKSTEKERKKMHREIVTNHVMNIKAVLSPQREVLVL